MSKRLRRENEYLTEEVKAGRNQRLLVGASPSFGKVVELVKAVTLTDTTVILLGETGTGKEVLAQALHDLDTRRQQPFIRVNCAALPLRATSRSTFHISHRVLIGHVEDRQRQDCLPMAIRSNIAPSGRNGRID